MEAYPSPLAESWRDPRRAELRRSIDEAKDAARGFLLAELSTAGVLLKAAEWSAVPETSARCREKARVLHDAVLERLSRLGLRPDDEQTVRAHAAELRQRLDAS
jgi:hypothetical protein